MFYRVDSWNAVHARFYVNAAGFSGFSGILLAASTRNRPPVQSACQRGQVPPPRFTRLGGYGTPLRRAPWKGPLRGGRHQPEQLRVRFPVEPCSSIPAHYKKSITPYGVIDYLYPTIIQVFTSTRGCLLGTQLFNFLNREPRIF